MMSKRIMPAILGASIALTPLIGLAQQEAGAEHASKRGHRMHKMERMLDLTDQQKQQLAAERKSEQARVKPYRDQVEAAHKQLQADVMSGKFDEAKARSILAETAQARTEVAQSHGKSPLVSDGATARPGLASPISEPPHAARRGFISR